MVDIQDRTETEADAYSKDYWDLVFEQLGRRKLFKLAATFLSLLYATAIFAPLLAGDRPFVLESADYGEYAKAQRTIYPPAVTLNRLARQTPEEFLAGRTEGSTMAYAEALQSESYAARVRVETMGSFLPEERREKLQQLVDLFEATVAASIGGDRQAAQERAGEAKALAKTIRTEYKAKDPTQPDSPGLELVSRRSYPLLGTISGIEAFFMVLWGLVLTWPLWNRLLNRFVLKGNRDVIRAWRKRKWLGALALSALCGLTWGYTLGGSSTFDVAPYKQGLTDGSIVQTSAVFPPFAYGFAETHPAETFRAPTWTTNSEISESGRYVRGPRSILPTDGHVPPATPVEVRFGEQERNAPTRHLLGTDSLGRDLLVRMIFGSRVSLSVGLVSAALLVLIGTIVGAIAGFFGGSVDILISRFIEIVLCFPAFFLILMVVALTDPRVIPPIYAIVIVIALVRWTGVARLARGEFLKLREAEFALAARALGFSSRRTIFKHILPNSLSPILVAGAFSIAAGILTESALSFLGFGIQEPIPSWGSLVNESKQPEYWWIQVFPGFMIFLTVTCYNLVGDAFRDALDPKMSKH